MADKLYRNSLGAWQHGLLSDKLFCLKHIFCFLRGESNRNGQNNVLTNAWIISQKTRKPQREPHRMDWPQQGYILSESVPVCQSNFCIWKCGPSLDEWPVNSMRTGRAKDNDEKEQAKSSPARNKSLENTENPKTSHAYSEDNTSPRACLLPWYYSFRHLRFLMNLTDSVPKFHLPSPAEKS